jgi:hypothetical protein
MATRKKDAATVREVEDETNEVEEEELNLDDVPLVESARESAEIALAEIQAESEVPGSQDEEQKKEDKSSVEKIEDPYQEELFAPESFKPHEKEAFNKAPPELKRALHRTEKARQAHFTKTQQNYQSAIKQAGGIIEAVRPYVDDWNTRGISPVQAIAALAAANKRLQDPNTRRSAMIELLADLEIDPSELTQDSNASNASNSTIQSHPYVKNLEAKINDLQTKFEPLYNQIQSEAELRIKRASDLALQELESVMYEKDAQGNWAYPKLHDPVFLEQWKPLVPALARTTENYADAARKAYGILTDSGGQNGQTKLPPANNVNTRAMSAAVSVRGKSAPVTAARPQKESDFEVPLNESAEDSARIALEELMRG